MEEPLSISITQSKGVYTAVVKEVKVQLSKVKLGQVTTTDEDQPWHRLSRVEIFNER